MPGSRALGLAAAALACLLAACAASREEPAERAAASPAPPPSREQRIRASTGAIDDARLRNADADVGNWLTHGRTYAEQRYSPLDQVRA